MIAMVLAVLTGCAAGGGAGVVGAASADEGEAATWREVGCDADIGEPRPFVAWVQINGGDGWRLVPEPIVDAVYLADGRVDIEVDVRQDVTACRAWAWM